MNETCLLLFADKKFTVVSDTQISNDEKSEIVSRALPKGSYWKKYTGGRSITFFSLDSSQRVVLCYSVITDDISIPAINFIILQEYGAVAGILQRQLIGIQSAYYRRMRRFFCLGESQAVLLSRNLLSLRVSGKDKFPAVQKPKGEYYFSNPLEWRVIENTIISTASKNLKKIVSFRTLSLQIDRNIQIVAVAQR